MLGVASFGPWLRAFYGLQAPVAAMVLMTGCPEKNDPEDEPSSDGASTSTSSKQDPTSSSTPSTGQDSSSEDAHPGPNDEDFLDFQDPKAPCTPAASGLGWETKLKRGALDPRVSVALRRNDGALLLGGTQETSLWLGLVSSSGTFVASKQLSSSVQGPRFVHAIDQSPSGELALAGVHFTEVAHLSQPVGLSFDAGSLLAKSWRVQGLPGRAESNDALRFGAKDNLFVRGVLRFEDTRFASFLASIDPKGRTNWSLDTTTGPLTRLGDFVPAKDGHLFILGVEGSEDDPLVERPVVIALDAAGTLRWKSYLDPAPKLGPLRRRSPPIQAQRIALSLNQTHRSPLAQAQRIALSADQTQLRVVGLVGEPTNWRAHIWTLGAREGQILDGSTLDTPQEFNKSDLPRFEGWLVEDGRIYYAWHAEQRQGNDPTGVRTRIGRLNAEGVETWHVDYSRDKGPATTPHVRITALVPDGAKGIYAVGQRLKVPAADTPATGERYSYVARFCPK